MRRNNHCDTSLSSFINFHCHNPIDIILLSLPICCILTISYHISWLVVGSRSGVCRYRSSNRGCTRSVVLRQVICEFLVRSFPAVCHCPHIRCKVGVGLSDCQICCHCEVTSSCSGSVG